EFQDHVEIAAKRSASGIAPNHPERLCPHHTSKDLAREHSLRPGHFVRVLRVQSFTNSPECASEPRTRLASLFCRHRSSVHPQALDWSKTRADRAAVPSRGYACAPPPIMCNAAQRCDVLRRIVPPSLLPSMKLVRWPGAEHRSPE